MSSCTIYHITYEKVMNSSKYVTLEGFFFLLCDTKKVKENLFYCNSGDIFHPILSFLGNIFNIYASLDANSHLFILPIRNEPN